LGDVTKLRGLLEENLMRVAMLSMENERLQNDMEGMRRKTYGASEWEMKYNS
jgi:hypothetical protein